MKRAAWTIVAALAATPAEAQLVEPNQMGLRMGHVHLAVTDVDAHTRFFTSVLGGTLVRNGPLELIQFPGGYVMLRRVAQPAPSPAGVNLSFSPPQNAVVWGTSIELTEGLSGEAR